MDISTCIKSQVIHYKSLKLMSEKTNRPCGEILQEIKEKYKRKILCFYGNCQISTMFRLARETDLMREYLLFSFGLVQSIRGEEQAIGFPSDIVEQIDILICQNVLGKTKIKKGLTTKSLIERLSSGASVVHIPNIYFRGYFPQVCANPYNVIIPGKTNSNGAFPWGDENIQKLAINHSAEEITSIISDEDFYSNGECWDNANDSLRELKEREKICDVKISDYIEANFQIEQLFFLVNHPQAFMMHELLMRAFRYLDMGFHPRRIENGGENTGREVLIYPSVKKHLMLRFPKNEYYYYKTLCEVPVDILGYVKAYLKYCGDNILQGRNK